MTYRKRMETGDGDKSYSLSGWQILSDFFNFLKLQRCYGIYVILHARYMGREIPTNTVRLLR